MKKIASLLLLFSFAAFARGKTPRIYVESKLSDHSPGIEHQNEERSSEFASPYQSEISRLDRKIVELAQLNRIENQGESPERMNLAFQLKKCAETAFARAVTAYTEGNLGKARGYEGIGENFVVHLRKVLSQ